jgi:catechol 2,3-dioxygenase-like lactoylglutathione lyase family enzyme
VTARFDLVTFDSPRPDRLARFWTEVLGLHEVEREDGDRWIVLADGAGVRRIGIQRGTTVPGSVHLDLACDPAAFDGEVERLCAAGAVLVSPVRMEPYGAIANLVDPDGNALDLCAYH